MTERKQLQETVKCKYLIVNYSLSQLLTFCHTGEFSFSQFLPLLQKSLETNDTSFESPKIVRLESGKKLVVASL